MTPREIILEARNILLDYDPESYRQSDSELLSYVNDGVHEVSILAPNLFYQTGELTCVSGRTEQTISFDDAQSLVDVIRVKNGRAVTPVDVTVLNKFMPDWGNEEQATAINWFRHSGDTLRFYLYPKAPPNQVLEVLYVRNPSTYSIDERINELPGSTKSVLANYVVYRAESKDDEHVNSQRALAFYNLFVGYFKPQQQT